ncbi:penicillin-insensitive transglycosylase & transpeptidase pbp-1c [hydrocarbon metagenome]|uniref:peptidoglycan glycosyltransferase n=1 Tax=hydrocarbon metagenome TaxID=938273 RepID=A0A0W8FZP3_9ZZZZ
MLLFLIILFVLDISFPLPNLKPYSKTIYSNNGTLLNAYLASDDKWRMRTNLDDVSPDLIKAIIEKEDKWFHWHLGVNPVAVARAFAQNLFSEKRVSGASTITMQTARLLEPAERTYINKILEMLRAVQLEFHYSKDEILEIYLSHLPFGGNIEGVKSASYIYFNRPPDKLSLSQSTLLTVIPNNPNKLRLDIDPAPAIQKRDEWIDRFIQDEVFDKQILFDAKDEPVIAARYQVPNLAPHFSNYLSRRYRNDQIKSSLDLNYQSVSETLLKKYVDRVKGKGVTNGAVLIIDNKNNSVRAYCGSVDFFDDKISGQVNGITSVRSPGSALKPALYAYAFDNGLLTPQMRLLDIPTDFGGYEPENYDLKFYGDVTTEFALANSLNVPAVRLMRQTGLNNMINLFERSGFETIAKSKNKLGLSLILGGCGVTLEELTKLFTTFSQNGKLYQLNYVNEEEKNNGRKIFTEESAYIIGRILMKNERPDFPAEFLFTTKLPRVAWKTGTSYGKRDAWAVGFNPNYTIGVWMGNFDGKGSPHLSGAEMAVPLLFELFNSIDYDSYQKWFGFPKNLKVRKVCAETGFIPSKQCTNIIDDYFIENHSPQKQCDLYKELFINEDETIEYCPECLPKEYKKAAYPFYDPELTLWQNRNNIKVKRPPKHNPGCSARFTSEGPVIISPSSEFEYFVEKGNEEEILLQAASNANVKTHYWFVNDKFYKKSSPEEKTFLHISEGNIKITCMDDRGRETNVNVKVSSY